MQSLISVIVPVYNAEDYLEKAIQSIVNQTYSNLEIFIIDDGSQDNSGMICDELSKKDSRIQVIHQINSGVSNARNTALDKIKGKYVSFMDADDYIENTMLENLVKIYDEFNVDLVNSGFYSEIRSYKKNETVSSSDKINYLDKLYCSKKEIKDEMVILWDKHQLYNVVNKLYIRDIIEKNNIRFPNHNFGEDIEFNRQYLLKINSMYNSSECYYHYVREREGAATQKFIHNLFDIRIKEHGEFKEYFDLYGVEQKDYIEFTSRRHVERTLGCLDNLFKPACNMSFLEKYKNVKRIIYDGNTRESLKYAKSTSKKIKVLLFPYKIRSVLLAMAMGKILFISKEKMPILFNKLKNRR